MRVKITFGLLQIEAEMSLTEFAELIKELSTLFPEWDKLLPNT